MPEEFKDIDNKFPDNTNDDPIGMDSDVKDMGLEANDTDIEANDMDSKIKGTDNETKGINDKPEKKTSHSGMRKTRIGKVLSNKMDKTIIVIEEKKVMHPIYKKYYKKTTKFAAHDPQNTCDIGDKVKIMETRPISRTKRWRLIEIVEKVK